MAKLRDIGRWWHAARHAGDLYKAFSPKGLLRRNLYYVRLKSGALKQDLNELAAARFDDDLTMANFFFGPQKIKREYEEFCQQQGVDTKSVIQLADGIINGDLLFFESLTFAHHGGNDWFFHPITSHHYPADKHFLDIPDSDANLGDIKYIWERSRFACVYPLARAFVATGETKYAAHFEQQVMDWLENNPPFKGPNWKCAQECSIRALAWLFGLQVFSKKLSVERRHRIKAALVLHARRISLTLDYALSQRNNHAVSELVFLQMMALVFPKLSEAEDWLEISDELLGEVVEDQFYIDGGYAQQSFNYQRLALDWLVMVARLREAHKLPALQMVDWALEVSFEFLNALVERQTGRLPNTGSNDGAHFLQLSNTEFSDFRPTLDAISVTLYGRHATPKGPWREQSFWLHNAGKAAEPKTPKYPSSRYSPGAVVNLDSGHFALKTDNALLYCRGHSPRHRPSQSDALHCDLIFNGENLLFDPGTYRYHDSGLWNNRLAHADVHNTARPHGHGPLVQMGKFLFVDWPEFVVTHHRLNDDAEWLQITTSGHESNPAQTSYTRVLGRLNSTFFVLDYLHGKMPIEYDLHWNFLLPADFTPQSISNARLCEFAAGKRAKQTVFITASEPMVCSTKAATEDDPRGWYSQRYGEKLAEGYFTAQVKSEAVIYATSFGESISFDKPLTLKFSRSKQTLKLSEFAYDSDGDLIVAVEMADQT